MKKVQVNWRSAATRKEKKTFKAKHSYEAFWRKVKIFFRGSLFPLKSKSQLYKPQLRFSSPGEALYIVVYIFFPSNRSQVNKAYRYNLLYLTIQQLVLQYIYQKNTIWEGFLLMYYYTSLWLMYSFDFICSIYTLMQFKCNSSFELVSLGCYFVSNKIKLRT